MREILTTEIVPAYEYVFNKKYEIRKILYASVLNPLIYDSVDYFKLITREINKTLEDTEI
jgi:hypothetical protein